MAEGQSPPRVLLQWMRCGPYHHARASSAKRSLDACGFSLLLCEVAASDQYAWRRTGSEALLQARILFENEVYGELQSREIARAVITLLNEVDPSVVVVNGWSAPEARAALNWAQRRPNCVSVVMSETKADDGSRYFAKELAKRWILRGAGAGLVGGRVQADYLASLGVPRDRIFLGYNAVDNQYFADSSSRIRSEQVEDATPYFFASARFLVRKNLDGLLRAYAVYRSRSDEPWGLVIAGSGDEESRLKALCAELGLDDHVRWPGFVQYDELPRWYAGAGAFIHPAKAEAWGLVVNEAAACSLPLLVARPVGARYELLEEGVNGFSFDPHSDADIAEAMLRISSMDDSARKAFGAAAKVRVDQYGPDRFASGLLSAIEAARKHRR